MKRQVLIAALISLTFVLTFTVSSNSQTPKAHPIDASLEKCLKIHKGTMPRAKCYSDAESSWEKDVADTYSKILEAAGDKRKAFEDSQKAWESFRDAEFQLISEVYGRKKGSGYIAVRITLRSEILKARALRLEAWLKTLTASE